MLPIQAGVSCIWTNDTQRLLLENFDMIHNSPSQLYHSALPFCPSSSWLHECYSLELSQEAKVIKGLPAEWGMYSRTAPLKDHPTSLSYWNNTIAVGSTDVDILILDVITGSPKAVLHGHTGYVKSVTFSSDGISLVSGSTDKTVKLWDVQTGGVVRTFHGHTEFISSVSISADHTTIASGSFDTTLRLWDVQKGECRQIIKFQYGVDCVRFSPTNPQCLISVSIEAVQQWDTNGCKVGPTYKGYWVTFSPDGTQLILHTGRRIVIQDIDSGVVVTRCGLTRTFAPIIPPLPCCFSPDHKLVAAATVDTHTIKVWNITGPDPHLIKTFYDHTGRVISLAFSSPSTLISASEDQSIKFWKIGTPSTGYIVADRKSTSLTLAPTKSAALKPKNGPIIPSDLPDGVIKSWGTLTGLHKGSLQIPAESSHQRNTQLIDNRLIFVWCADKKINIWDAKKGELLQTINVPVGSVKGLKVSGDGTKVFCAYKEYIQAWDIRTGEAAGEVRAQDVRLKDRDAEEVRILATEGSKIWAQVSMGGWFCEKRWDFGIPGSSPVLFPHDESPPEMFHLSDNKVWEASMSRMKDTVTGKVVVQLPERFRHRANAQWDGHYLIIHYWPEPVILDFSNVSL